MSRPSVFLKAMRDQRWMVLGFGVGGALMAALVLGIYPSYREALALVEIPPALEALVGDVDLASAEGFFSVEFFVWIPVLLVVYAIVQGTGVLAGEESSGTLDLLLAQPISRTRLFIEKAMSIVVGTLVIVLLILPGWAVTYGAADIDLALGRLMLATVAMAPLMLAFAALSLLAGAAHARLRCALPPRRRRPAYQTRRDDGRRPRDGHQLLHQLPGTGGGGARAVASRVAVLLLSRG